MKGWFLYGSPLDRTVTEVIPNQVDHDLPEVTAEGVPITKMPEAAKGTDKGVLNYVLSQVWVSG